MTEYRPVKKIVVVGGGTAGWMAANVLRAIKKRATRIVLIESPNVPSIGVGEALTPFFYAFLRIVGYDPLAFIRDVGGSVKLGVRFENWLRNGHVYYHPFQDGGGYVSKPEFSVSPGYNRLISYAIASGVPLHYLTTSYASLCDRGKVPWLPTFVEEEREYSGYGAYAFNMDTAKFAETFRSLAVGRGVDHIRADVVDLELEESGFIQRLVLEDGRRIAGDFFVDCTGFRRLLLSRISPAPTWESYAEWLPVNSAIPFRVPYRQSEDGTREEIPSCILARAMNAGWLWKVPLADRYGAGYVYCDELLTEEEARREVETTLDPGVSVSLGKRIRFSAGTLSRTWVKNCAGVGLSTGFVEPLESTAIQIALAQALGLADVLRDPFAFDERVIDFYNRSIKQETDDIRDFIILHYATDRADTPFWRHVADNKERLNYPDSLRDKIVGARHRTLGHNRVQSEAIRGRAFGELSHLYVMQSLGLSSRVTARADIRQEFDSVREGLRKIERHVDRLREAIRSFTSDCVSHRRFLERLAGAGRRRPRMPQRVSLP